MYSELEKDLKSFMRKLSSEKKFDESSLVKEGFQELVRIRINLKEITERAEKAEAIQDALIKRIKVLEKYLPLAFHQGYGLGHDHTVDGHFVDDEDFAEFYQDTFVEFMNEEQGS